MNEQEYCRLALATERKFNEGLTLNIRQTRLLHGGLLLSTEANEFLSALKAHLFYGKPLDFANALEEIGDAFWSLALLLDELGFTFPEAWAANIAKLELRYKGQSFNPIHAQRRDLIAERALLEASAGCLCDQKKIALEEKGS